MGQGKKIYYLFKAIQKMNNKNFIHIKGVCKRFANHVVLDKIDFYAESGQCLLLLGRNGVGKSTLFNCMINLIKPEAGEILINGMSYNQYPVKIKELIGVMSDDNPLMPEFTAQQYLEFVGILRKIPKNELQERIETLFDFFFEDRKDIYKRTSTYSTGMKKRLSLCAAVLHRPALLILDEPFAGLDLLSARKLTQFIKFYLSNERIVILSSHDFTHVNHVATHISVLNNGNIVFNDTIDTFTQNGHQRIEQSLWNILSLSEETDIHTIAWIK